MTPRPSIYVTTLIAAAFFMENLDGTIIATALPQMAKSFHVGAVNLNIGMTAYLLTLAVFIPISGWSRTASALAPSSPPPSASSRWRRSSAAWLTR